MYVCVWTWTGLRFLEKMVGFVDCMTPAIQQLNKTVLPSL